MITTLTRSRPPLVAGTHNDADNIHAWLAEDFDQAYRKGQWKRRLNRWRRKDDALMSMDDLTGGCRIRNQIDRGIQVIPIAEIVGSVGRNQDFDRSFMPRRVHIRGRWDSINRAYYLAVPLPPVELMQVDGQYVVIDGHHRISVARAHGQHYLEAHITQAETACKEQVGRAQLS